LFYLEALRGQPHGVFYAPYQPGIHARLTSPAVPHRSDVPDRDTVALIDSGVVTSHPLLRTRIIAAQDFTGEGLEDTWGHGTMRALRTLASQPAARLIIAKVVGRRPGGRRELIEALDWAAAAGAGVLWLALGEFNWWCRGWCALCRAAAKVADSDRVVIAAPGNRAGQTACPAKARGVVPTVPTPYHLRRPKDYLDRLARLATVPVFLNYMLSSSPETSRHPGRS